ncbi:hypothetical protein [Burkholderia ambifaria]|uniref:Uncharacterized protein n=1 Tax=Burkholderia ambifaria TaxID=152480 RepID=A0AA41E3M7_9BURK|nr:hypothetical protein [Burkholderia ambifaria]MBR8127846.1 hypothetical protein [Burkholderia ambifaria]
MANLERASSVMLADRSVGTSGIESWNARRLPLFVVWTFRTPAITCCVSVLYRREVLPRGVMIEKTGGDEYFSNRHAVGALQVAVVSTADKESDSRAAMRSPARRPTASRGVGI